MNSFGLPKMPDTRYIRLWSCKAYTKNAVDKELSLSIFAKAAKRTSRKWGAFFCLCFGECLFYLSVFGCLFVFFTCFRLFSPVWGLVWIWIWVWFGFGFRFGFAYTFLYLYLFIFVYVYSSTFKSWRSIFFVIRLSANARVSRSRFCGLSSQSHSGAEETPIFLSASQ